MKSPPPPISIGPIIVPVVVVIATIRGEVQRPVGYIVPCSGLPVLITVLLEIPGTHRDIYVVVPGVPSPGQDPDIVAKLKRAGLEGLDPEIDRH